MLTLGLAITSPASAALLQFELTGSRQASFQIDTDTIPDTFSFGFIRLLTSCTVSSSFRPEL